MAKPFIAHARLSDAAALTASSESAALPVTNLQARQPGDVWRPEGLTPYVVIDLGAAFAASPQVITVVALMALNISAAASWRIRAATSEAGLTGSPAYDSGTGQMRQPGSNDDWPLHIALKWLDPSLALTCRWWRIDVDDSGNGDGYLDFGRLYVAATNQLSLKHAKGATIGYGDLSRKQRSAGGQRFSTRRPPERVISFSIDYGSESEMLGDQLDLDLERGIARDVLCCLDHEITTYLAQRTIYGEFQSLSPVSLPVFARYAKRFIIEELRP